MTDLASIIIAIISLVILWAIVSIPVWVSAKIFASRRASFGRAMLVTVAEPVVYVLVLIISTSIISLAVGNRLSLITSLGVVLAFLAWIYVFKSGFETSWIRAAAIAIVAIIVFVIIGVAIASVTHLAGNSHGYEILYFGVNLILVLNYRLSFDVEVKNSNKEIQVLIFSRKDIPAWKESKNSQITPYYSRQGTRINDVFRPTASDAYAFVLNNQFSNKNTHDNIIKTVEATLIHNWQHNNNSYVGAFVHRLQFLGYDTQ